MDRDSCYVNGYGNFSDDVTLLKIGPYKLCLKGCGCKYTSNLTITYTVNSKALLSVDYRIYTDIVIFCASDYRPPHSF